MINFWEKLSRLVFFIKVESKVQSHDEHVNLNIGEGAELHGNKLKREENKAKVQSAVDAFTQRHSNAKTKVDVAKRL